MTSLNLVAYDRIGLANPVPESAIGEVLDLADLRPGERAAELGCGNGALAIILARRGLSVTAVDRGDAMVALARRRVADAGLSGQIAVIAAEAGAVAVREGPFRLVSAVGTTALTDFSALASWIAPGGWLLWGDLFWKSAPKVKLAGGGLDYDTEEGWRARAQAARLEPFYLRISTDTDWAGYVEGLTGAVAAWAEANPSHADRHAIETRARTLAAMYAPENLRSLGFVLYLFRKPE